MEHSPLTTSRPSPRHHLSHLSSPRPPHHFFPSPNLEPRRRSEREELSLTTSTRTPHLATSRTSLPTSPAYRLPSLSPLSSARPSRAARCASTSPTSTCATTSRRRWTWWTRSPSPPVPFCTLPSSSHVYPSSPADFFSTFQVVQRVFFIPPPPTLHSPTAACPVPCTMFADRCLTCTLPCPVRTCLVRLRFPVVCLTPRVSLACAACCWALGRFTPAKAGHER